MNNAKLRGTFAEAISKNMHLLEENKFNLIKNSKQLLFGMTINKELCNYQGSLHGGAVSTIID